MGLWAAFAFMSSPISYGLWAANDWWNRAMEISQDTTLEKPLQWREVGTPVLPEAMGDSADIVTRRAA